MKKLIQKKTLNLYGSKAENLIKLSYNGVTVPLTWVIRNNYPLSILKRYKVDLSNINEVREFFKNFPDYEYCKIYKIVENFIKENNMVKRFAIRSSQLYEDGNENSFSGLFYTELNVGNVANIVNSIIKCWEESFNIGVIEYSKNNAEFNAIPCSVIIQQFILSNKSGVIFKLQDKIILDSNYGLAKSIVDGDTGCDEWIISNTDRNIIKYSNNKEKINVPITKRINPNKGEQINYQYYKNLLVNSFDNVNTIIEVILPQELKEAKSLNHSEIEELLSTCNNVSNILNIENYDIEWTFDDKGKLYILQCRPITSEFEVNNNISENSIEYGIGLVNGEVVGKVNKVYDDESARNFHEGDILVTKRLAGSSLLSANKAIGCLIESKSPLSHSAIIARELGIPVVGNINIDKIKDNEIYYINGKTGEYYIKSNEYYKISKVQETKENITMKNYIKNEIMNSIYTFKQDIFKE